MKLCRLSGNFMQNYTMIQDRMQNHRKCINDHMKFLNVLADTFIISCKIDAQS